MKSRIFVLGAVLAVQLVLAAVVNLTGEDFGIFEAEETLLSFDKNAVASLQIDSDTDSVVLKKQAGQWLLPENGDMPASQRDVEQLLDKLAALEKGWPVADTRGAAKRFRVDEAQFERKLVLVSNDDVRTTLFVGSSPGFRKVYVRLAGEDEIYAVDFSTWEANAKADDWIDQDLLSID